MEQRDKFGKFVKGHNPPIKWRIKWGDTRKKRGYSSWMKGKHHTEESKKKLRLANKGKHYSPKTEFKKGIVPWSKGKTKENYESLKKGGIQGSITKKKLFKEGKIKIWNKGLTKETDGRVKKYSETNKNKSPWNKGKTGVYSKEHIEFLRKNKLGSKHTEEAIKKIKKKRAKQVLPTKDSSIEVKIQNFLKELKMDFFIHQYMKEINHSYQCDILIPALNLVIECDGNYFHKYPIGRNIDHIRTKELLEKGFKVLRLWECEIKVMNLNDFKNRLKNG